MLSRVEFASRPNCRQTLINRPFLEIPAFVKAKGDFARPLQPDEPAVDGSNRSSDLFNICNKSNLPLRSAIYFLHRFVQDLIQIDEGRSE